MANKSIEPSLAIDESDFKRHDVNLYWLDITGEKMQRILSNQRIVYALRELMLDVPYMITNDEAIRVIRETILGENK